MHRVVIRGELALVIAVPVDDPDRHALGPVGIAHECDLRAVRRPPRRDAPGVGLGEL